MKTLSGTDSPDRSPRGRPRDWHDKTAQNTIKSLDRAMLVFDHLSTLGGATLSDLANGLSQAPATVYRVLVTLEGRGLVDFDPAAQTWHIGPKAFLIGSAFLRRTSLVERARPVLRQLMEATGETANLGIERGGKVLFLSQVETHATIRAFFPPGTASEMHASGIGKVLLAHMSADRRWRWMAAAPLTAFTAHTLSEPDALEADLGQARDRGYAIDGEERNLGMRCIAAPVRDVHGEVIAGLSVSGPTSRITLEAVPDLARAVLDAAADLSRGMGAP